MYYEKYYLFTLIQYVLLKYFTFERIFFCQIDKGEGISLTVNSDYQICVTKSWQFFATFATFMELPNYTAKIQIFVFSGYQDHICFTKLEFH